MPVKSLNSSIRRWPNNQSVKKALHLWAKRIKNERPDVICIGYFGSYARGDWGVGSDLDLLIIVRKSDLTFERRGAQVDTTDLPVPTDILVYTSLEFKNISRKGRFGQMLMKELIWIDGNSQCK